ncbi:phosphopantetheine-binding protein [Streptomyces sp. NPDC051051]|uniref:phosphopantetheine-binding protein n=1 Tax=Streptomyces sp. NPDC051051 TaxID=3155666 RepID=UPI003438FEF7
MRKPDIIEEQSVNGLSYSDFETALRQSLPFLDEGTPVDANASLTELGLDSLTLLNLVAEIEDRFSVELPDEMLVMETFATPSTLWNGLLKLPRA